MGQSALALAKSYPLGINDIVSAVGQAVPAGFPHQIIRYRIGMHSMPYQSDCSRTGHELGKTC
jgi:hypothetical protein